MNTATAITLVAVDCAYPELAIAALQRSARALPVARTLLLTDRELAADGVDVRRIAPIRSRAAYSQFMLKALAPFITTDYALVVQWDGFVIDGTAWADEFWNYDYIGARWPHRSGDFRVGNGGFSLRSRRLLHALQDPVIELGDDNEDEAIGIRHREHLERAHGIVFAEERVADRFAFDVGRPIGPTLGFHGVFNFWQVLDDDALIAFARTAPEAIAGGLGFGALCRNLVDLKRHAVAREFVTRRLAVLPDEPLARELKARLDADTAPAAANAAPDVAPPRSRNDPCPCGGGKRYKECHGKIGAAAPTATMTPAAIDATLREALALHERGDLNAAGERYARILQAAPEEPTALHYAGLMQYQSGQPAAALELMWRSVCLEPREPEFWSNIAAAAFEAGRYDEGRWAAERALALAPEHVGAWNNLGFNLRAKNDVEGSLRAFDRALDIAPGFDYARWNRTFSLLALGDYARGFADYELRLRFPQTQPSGRIPDAPMWRGEAVAADARHLLILCEQGLGDTFMFARFVPLVLDRGFNVTFAVQRSQVALMRQSFPAVEVIAVGEHEARRFDRWVALWSLPAALGITLDHLPAPTRFLVADPAAVADWRARLAALPTIGEARPLTVGIVWEGRFAGQNTQMAERSLPARRMRRLVDAHPELRWVSLQHGAPPLEHTAVVDWTEQTVDFTAMAALIDALDLVISIDTGAAHLAAALGAPTWVLLREAGDWRYGIRGEYTPWSPTMRLFRQDASRRWEPVLAAVSDALRHAAPRS